MARAGRSRKARKITLPPSLADHGPQTEAQNAGTTLESVPDDKNGSTRRVRKHILLRMKGLSPRQQAAGLAISEAYEATQKSPPAIKEIQVDSSPKPDACIGIQIDRASRHAWLKAAVPPQYKYVVDHVCENGNALRDGLPYDGHQGQIHLAPLQVSLDLVANKMRI